MGDPPHLGGRPVRREHVHVGEVGLASGVHVEGEGGRARGGDGVLAVLEGAGVGGGEGVELVATEYIKSDAERTGVVALPYDHYGCYSNLYIIFVAKRIVYSFGERSPRDGNHWTRRTGDSCIRLISHTLHVTKRGYIYRGVCQVNNSPVNSLSLLSIAIDNVGNPVIANWITCIYHGSFPAVNTDVGNVTRSCVTIGVLKKHDVSRARLALRDRRAPFRIQSCRIGIVRIYT